MYMMTHKSKLLSNKWNKPAMKTDFHFCDNSWVKTGK